MKRRKRTSKAVPAKGRLRDMADQLWALAIKDDWDNRCAVCDRSDGLNSHHLIPRQHEQTRYDMRNGICLCCNHHQFCPDVSPHQNAGGFLLWLETNEHERFRWLMHTLESGAHKGFSGTKNAEHYCSKIDSLVEYVSEEDYERILGVRFAAWLAEWE